MQRRFPRSTRSSPRGRCRAGRSSAGADLLAQHPLAVRPHRRAVAARPGAEGRGQGYDWRAHFEDFQYTEQGQPNRARPVTTASTRMALKTPAMRSRLSGDPADRDAVARMLELLDRYHGQATGIFTCDEHLAGRTPRREPSCAPWSRRCFRWSAAGRLGRAGAGRPAGALAYNALPATFTPECGRTSTTSRRTRSSARSRGATSGQQRARFEPLSGWSRTSAAAPPTCTRAGRNSRRTSGCAPRRRTGGHGVRAKHGADQGSRCCRRD